MNIIFDAALGSALWTRSYPFMAGALIVAMAAQGVAMSRLYRDILWS